MEVGTVVKLKGKTQKGKNRVRELGENWKITGETTTPWSLGKDKPANTPLLRIFSMDSPLSDNAGRLIAKENDADFEIVGAWA